MPHAFRDFSGRALEEERVRRSREMMEEMASLRKHLMEAREELAVVRANRDALLKAGEELRAQRDALAGELARKSRMDLVVGEVAKAQETMAGEGDGATGVEYTRDG